MQENKYNNDVEPVEMKENVFQKIKDNIDFGFKQYFAPWGQKLPGYKVANIATIVALVVLVIIIIYFCCKKNYRHTPRKENYGIEMGDGSIVSEDVYYKNGSVYSSYGMDGKNYTKKEEARGYNLDGKPANLLNAPAPIYEFQGAQGTPQNNGGIAQIQQKLKTNTILSKPTAEKYIGMKQCTKEDDYFFNNYDLQQKTLNDMGLLKNQVENTMILRSPNIDNNTIINNIDAMKQMTSAKQKQLNDVNEIEQEQRNQQVVMDHNHMIGSAYGKNIQMSGASTAQQQNTNTAVKFLTNSNVPSVINVPLTQETVQAQVAYTNQPNIQKEVAIKNSGPTTIKVDVPSKVTKQMETTAVTKEPVVNTNTNQVILDQSVENDPKTGKLNLVETTMDLDSVGKTENFVRKFPTSKMTQQQRAALNYLFTILFIYKVGAVEIPSLQELLSIYSQLYKIYNLKSDTYTNFVKMDKRYGNWVQTQIANMNSASNETMDVNVAYVIKTFMNKYNINPVQKYVAGTVEKQSDGSVRVEKDTTTIAPENESIRALDNSSLINPQTESYQRKRNGNYKIKKEHYSYVVKNGRVHKKLF